MKIYLQIKVCPIRYSSLSPQVGSCIVAHSLCLNGENYMILLENGQDLSEFEGYNINLQEFLEEQSFLKRKHIVGSKTGECMFVRNIGKSIIRSIFAYFIKLFSCHKCIKMNIGGHTKILLKGSKVKFYGVEFVEYDENLAIENVVLAVELVRGCFPLGSIPCDLEDMLDLLLEDPLQNLQAAEDDCSLKSAKERRELLVLLHTEYMTNVKPKLCGEGDGQQNCNDFFKGCPYLYSWVDTMFRNTYLTAVANYNSLLGDKKLEKRKEEEREKKKEEEREKEDENLENEEDDVRRIDDGKLGEKGELQLCVMRNCDVHIPENAVKVNQVILLCSFCYNIDNSTL